MAASVNKVIFIGNIGRDVDFRDHGNGFMTVQFSVATTETWRDRGEGGERRERTEWHRIEARGRLAEIVRDIMGQGDQVYVEGKLQHDKVERKGEPGKFDFFTKVVAESVQKLGKRDRTGGAGEEGGDAGGAGEHSGDAGGDGNDAPAAAAPSPAPAPAPAPRASGGGASKWRSRGTK
jgi:single-strand DNA-binding protein